MRTSERLIGKLLRKRRDSRDTLPPLSSIQRHRTLRLIAGIGTIAMLAILGTVWIWLWYDHEQLVVTKPPLTKAKLVKPSADRTPPALVSVVAPRSASPATPATAAHIRALKTRT